jgi:hypothetical protein
MGVARAGLVVAHVSVPLSVGAATLGILSVAMHDEHSGAALLGAGLVGIVVVAPVGDVLLLSGSLAATRSLQAQGIEASTTAGFLGVGMLAAGEGCLAVAMIRMNRPGGWGLDAADFLPALALHYGTIVAGTIQKRVAKRACNGCTDIVLAPAILPTGSSRGIGGVLGPSPWLPGATLSMRW